MVKSSSPGPDHGGGIQPRSRGQDCCAAQRRFSAFGVVVGLRGNHEDALEQAAARLRWLGWTPDSSGPCACDVDYELRVSLGASAGTAAGGYELRCDGSFVYGVMDLGQVLDAFDNHAKLLTAERAEGRLFVHAGAVAWRDCGIVIPGRSHSGKTTLVRALVDAGATYYSDEFALLDQRGCLHPYPLPLSIRSSGTQPALRTRVEVGAERTGIRPVPVRLVIVSSYRPYARWRPRLLSQGEAFLALMEHTVAARRAPETAMALLRPTALAARTIKTIRGNARSVAAAVLAEADELR